MHMRPSRIDVFAIFWILLIIALLMGNLSSSPLWQDEAESALNSLTISSGSPIPKGSADGSPALLHEMSLYFKADSPKYEYLPTHYLKTPYVTIHGWLPYYFIRLGIAIFGKNEFGPRVFSVVFFGLSLAALYMMLRQSTSPVVALCVVVYFSLMSTMLGYAMQARYYAYEMFFNLFGIFSFWRFTQNQSRSRFWIWVISEILLYYTFISAFILHQAVFVLFFLMSRRALLIRYCLFVAVVGMFALPHLWITKFPVLALKIPACHTINLKSLLMLLSVLEGNVFLVISIIAFISVHVFRIIKHTLYGTCKDIDYSFNMICLLMIMVGYPLFTYTSPLASFYPRLFIPITPFLIFAAFSHISPNLEREKGYYMLRVVIFVCIFLFVIFNPITKGNGSTISDLVTLRLKLNKNQTGDTRWVFDALKYIRSTDARKPLILTSFNHFVIAYYTNYEVELIWPLKKGYIDNLEKRFFYN